MIAGFWGSLGVAALLLSLIEGANLLLGGVPWPSSPEVEPDPNPSMTWTDTPIIAKNSSGFFVMRNVSFICAWTNVTFEPIFYPGFGMTAVRLIGYNKSPVKQTYAEITPGAAVTFSCDLSKLDTMKYANGQAWKIVLINMDIRTTFDTKILVWKWHRVAKSQPWTWREVSGGYQWLPGSSDDLNE